MTTTHGRLTRALNALGRTADQVADTLLAGGWTGLRSDGIACPISKYVVSVVPLMTPICFSMLIAGACTLSAVTSLKPVSCAAGSW